MITYQEICVWVVTAAGTVVLTAFAIFFCTTVMRLVRASTAPAPAQVPAGQARCKCGSWASIITGIEVVNDVSYEKRQCRGCQAETLTPQS